MLPKNLTMFRFPTSLRAALEDLEAAAKTVPLRAVGAYEMATRGFVPPLGGDDGAFTHRVGDNVLICLGGEDKLLPSSVVTKEIGERIKAIRERDGRNPGGRERKRIKDEVLTDLLPRAFSRPSRCYAWLDLARGWLIVDTSSRKVAESVVTALREALGTFPALPVNAESSPRALMTAWISGEHAPEGFLLGDECELRDPVQQGAIVKCRNQELESDELQEHLKSGKQAFQLGLEYAERLSFVLGEDVVIRKLKFLDLATAPLLETERDSLAAELDATFALASGEVRRLLDALEAEFSLSKAEG